MQKSPGYKNWSLPLTLKKNILSLLHSDLFGKYCFLSCQSFVILKASIINSKFKKLKDQNRLKNNGYYDQYLPWVW